MDLPDNILGYPVKNNGSNKLGTNWSIGPWTVAYTSSLRWFRGWKRGGLADVGYLYSVTVIDELDMYRHLIKFLEGERTTGGKNQGKRRGPSHGRT
jgi:hypothetical protein